MDLTFQIPMQYCSLQHRTLLLSPVTSIAGCSFCFGSIPSYFLELFLHWSPVAYWAPTDLGSSSLSTLSFCLFVLFMGFSRQEYWSGLPFPSAVDHILSDVSTMTHPSWVAPRLKAKMVLIKIEMHEGVSHSKQVFKKQHPKVLKGCVTEIDFFCIMLRPVLRNYKKKNFRTRGAYYKRRHAFFCSHVRLL